MPLTEDTLRRLLEQGGSLVAFLAILIWYLRSESRQRTEYEQKRAEARARFDEQIIDRLDKLVDRVGSRDEAMLAAMAQQHDATRQRITEARGEMLEAVRNITTVCAVAQQVQRQQEREKPHTSRGS